MKAAAAAMPPKLNLFLIEIGVAFPPHDDELEEGVEGVGEDALAECCQCESCQLDRGELDTVPEPIVYEIFY
ncbi:MAG: hypothetical protein ACR2FS_13480 [Phormidesmis sp.]